MSNPAPAEVTKLHDVISASSTDVPLPRFLRERAVTRLRIVAYWLAGVFAVGWVLGVSASAGGFANEFGDPLQWLPPTVAIVCSLMIVAATKNERVNPSTVLAWGLVYQVLVAYAIALGTYWQTFSRLSAADVTSDLIGWSPVAVWMLFFTVFVPTRPRHALAALLASATAPGLVYAVFVRIDEAPQLSAGMYTMSFVFPYAATAAGAFVAARIIYRLGQDVHRAREMGSYRLEEQLGAGGMGEVWRAGHHLLACPAAIKLIRREALGSEPRAVDMATARFEREAQVTARLRSPHTVELYDFGVTEDGALYYVMELLDGIDLDHMVRRYGALEPARAIYLLRQACASLAEAHALGLIHRDVKPANLHVCRMGLEYDVLKVLDFGLVRRRVSVAADSDDGLSQAGTFVGTPTFMAPEMATRPDEVDGRADLYALGCVGYWMLTGQTVFAAPSMAAMMIAHVNREPPALAERAPHPVPEALDHAMVRCLAKNPDDRFATAADLDAVLRNVAAGEPWSSDRARAWWVEHVPRGTG